jgi:hypothetical protein
MSTTKDIADLENNLLSTDDKVCLSTSNGDGIATWSDETPDSPKERMTISEKDRHSIDIAAIPGKVRSLSAPTATRPTNSDSNKHFSRLVVDVSKSFRLSMKRQSSVPLYNCQICLENHALSEAFSLSSCAANHQFCVDSLGMLLASQINDGVLLVRCPCFGVDSCKGMFSAQDIQKLVDDECYKKYTRFSAMKKNPNLRDCPKCGQVSSEGSENTQEITCSRCSEVYCFLHANAHPNSTCSSYTKSIAKAEMKSLRQIRAITHPCPHCKVDTEKSGGCNHMTCQACKAVRHLFFVIYVTLVYCS